MNISFQNSDPVALAISHGLRGYSCSEAIIRAFAEPLGLPLPQATRIASGFGGGMGLMGETCGAVTAAFMIIGLYYGTDDPSHTYERQLTYMQVAEFAYRFKAKTGNILCRELCFRFHSATTPEGAQALRESGEPQRMIETAAILLENMFQESLEDSN